MTKYQINRLLTIVVCTALVVLVLFLSFHTPGSDTCLNNNNTSEPGQKLERAGTEMLWESLSHQFVSLEY